MKTTLKGGKCISSLVRTPTTLGKKILPCLGAIVKRECILLEGTLRQFSEDDLRSRIFGTFVVKFLVCLPLLGLSNF